MDFVPRQGWRYKQTHRGRIRRKSIQFSLFATCPEGNNVM